MSNCLRPFIPQDAYNAPCFLAVFFRDGKKRLIYLNPIRPACLNLFQRYNHLSAI